jgi:hypothetical protein
MTRWDWTFFVVFSAGSAILSALFGILWRVVMP